MTTSPQGYSRRQPAEGSWDRTAGDSRDLKSVLVTIRVTPDEMLELTERARSSGQSVSQVVRARVFSELPSALEQRLARIEDRLWPES